LDLGCSRSTLSYGYIIISTIQIQLHHVVTYGSCGEVMSVRVHKVIGYGLTDIKHKCGEIVDPRFNTDALHKLLWRNWGDSEKAGDFTVAKFLRWIACNRRRLVALSAQEGREVSVRNHRTLDEGIFLMHYRKERRLWGPPLFKFLEKHKLDFSSAVISDTDGGKGNVMVFQPFSSVEEWSRSDNIVDYCEETAHFDSRSRVKSLVSLCGIFPYSGTMVRVRDPKIELLPPLSELGAISEKYKSRDTVSDKHGIPYRMVGGEYNKFVGRWARKQKPIAQGALLDHFLNDWRPMLPLELVWMLTYMNDKGCFSDVEAIKRELRPLLYVYWR
jgi:hypothetical protein